MQDTYARKIGVYEPSTPSKSKADYFISVAQAQQLVKDRKASFINRRSAVRMEKQIVDPPERAVYPKPHSGLSAMPSPALEERYIAAGNAKRDPEGRIAIDCWAGTVKVGTELVVAQAE